MAIRVIETRIGCPPVAVWSVIDDRRHTYLGVDGRWRVVPWHFASAQEAHKARQAHDDSRKFAIR